MTPQEVEQVAQLFADADAGWVLETDREVQAAKIVKEMKAVEACYKRKFPARHMRSPLLTQCLEEPSALRPLIQAFAAPMTKEMRTMIYCVLKGASVERVAFDYAAMRRSSLSIGIKMLSGERATFDSGDIWDFEVLRHFGTAKKGGKPLIDGYYAFRK